MKKILSTAILVMSFAGAAQAAVPQPRLLVIDRNAILQFSKVGQDISRQIQAQSNQARGELGARAKSLQSEGQTLQQQIAILSAEQKASKVRSFEARQAAFQADAQKREAMIQGGFAQARNAVAKALDPILQQIMKERGANMLLEKQAVVYATDNSYDITPDAINRLNQRMPTVKVTPVAPPQAAPAPRK